MSLFKRITLVCLLLIKVLTNGAHAQACATAPAGLVSWWSEEGNAYDQFSLNDGSLVGGTSYAPGKVGQAFSFNGAGQGVVISNSAGVQLQDFTIEAWIRRTDATAVSQGSLGIGFLFDFGGGGFGFCMNPDGRLTLAQLGVASGAITDTRWHHVAVSKSGGKVVFYIDGLAQVPLIYNATLTFSTPAAIGARADNLDNSFLGLIDELAVYSRALSTKEIQSVFNAGTLGKCVASASPAILVQPTNQTNAAGFSTVFSVVAMGTHTLSYQWYLNAVKLVGASNAFLALKDITALDAGSYSVQVSNALGVIISSNAVLTVNQPASCLPATSGLVSWWPAEGNALDSSGINHGVVGTNVTFVKGNVGQAFSFDGHGSGIPVSDARSLQLQSFTIEALIRRSDPRVASYSSDGNAVLFGFGSGGYAFILGASGRLALSQLDTSAVTLANPPILDTNLHHVAVTKSNGDVKFYLDGEGYPGAAYFTDFNFITAAVIGGRGDGLSNSFLGAIDELAIYSRPLEPEEVRSLYLNSSAGKCPIEPRIITQPMGETVYAGQAVAFEVVAGGSPALSYQWKYNGVAIPAATRSSLTITNVQESNNGSYSVVVSNAYGVSTSSDALLNVNSPGTCLSPPAGLVSWWPGNGNALDPVGFNDGSIEGDVGFGPGEVREGFVFNDTGQAVSVGNPVTLQLQDFTIEAWIRRANASICSYTPGGVAVLFGYGGGGYGLILNPDGALGLSQIDYSQVQLTNRMIVDTNLHHVAVTKSGTRVFFYVDGVQYSVDNYGPVFGFNTTAAIGARGDNFDHSFLGTIDELSIYSRTLAAAEIVSDYQASTLGKCPIPSPPQLLSLPLDQTVYSGQTATFNVVAAGGPAVTYQWLFNGAIMPGQNSSTLLITNVQANASGEYSVTVSNAYGMVTSSSGTLSVDSPPPCAVVPARLVSWWQAEGNALDQNGGNHGVQTNGAAYRAGRVGQGFVFNGRNQGVVVGNPSNLQLQNFSIEAWIKRGSTSVSSYGSYGSALLLAYGSGGYGLFLDLYGRLALGQIDGNTVTLGGHAITDENWHHVAVTKDGDSVTFYIDGNGHAGGAYNPTFVFNTPLAIGSRGDTLDNTFLGTIDEPSVYQGALSAAEIQSIYAASVFGKCPLLQPPQIVAQPLDQTVLIDLQATFSVTPNGIPPLNFQWRFNGTDLPGATNTVLRISSVQTNDVGNYSVVVRNEFGSMTSSNAFLTIGRPPSCLPAPSNLAGWWPGDGNAIDWASANDGKPVGNPTYGPGKVGQAFAFNGQGQGISVGNPLVLQLQDFTIEAWIQRANFSIVSSSIGAMLFAYGAGGYGLYLDPSGHLGLSQIDTGSLVLTEPGIHDTNLHHVAVTKSGSAVVFYIDGNPYHGGDYNPSFIFNTPAAIGARGDNLGNCFLGSIDELSIYSRALSPEEVQRIVLASASGKCPPPPAIVAPPQDETIFAGKEADLAVVAGGAPPLSYQWTFGGIALAGATNSTLRIPNAQTNNAGAYAVNVSNGYGIIISSNANLKVLNPPPCLPPPPGMVGWWPAEGTGIDQAGGNDGTAVGNPLYGPGEVGQSFLFNGNGQGVVVGNPLALQLQDFTIEAWIQRGSPTMTSLSGNAILFGYGTGGYGLYLDAGGHLALSQMDSTALTLNAPVIVDTNLHHVAVTKTRDAVFFYIDGNTYSGGSYNPTFVFNTPAAIGARADNMGNSFLGSIDELAIFARALSLDEISAIYAAAISGKCPLRTPPGIFAQPGNQTIYIGSEAAFRVKATGLPPLQYQWQLNGAVLAGATNSSLILTNAQTDNAGLYSVSVSNQFGTTLSGSARLTVLPRPPCFTTPSSLVGWWPGESDAVDRVSGVMATPTDAVTFQKGEVGTGFALNGIGQGVKLRGTEPLQWQDFTLETWIRRSSDSVVTRDITGYAYLFAYGSGGYGFYLDPAGHPGLSQLDYSAMTLTTASIADTNFHHVAVTKSGSTVFFYIDGIGYPAPGPFNGTFAFNSQAAIGARGDSMSGSFLGLIDELSLYTEALSASRIGSIYSAAVSGKCPAIPRPVFFSQPTNQTVFAGASAEFSVEVGGRFPLTFQWRLNGVDLAGETNKTLSIPSAQSRNAGSYVVIVRNSFGSVASEPATLTVNPVPPCLLAPPGLVSWWPGQSNVVDIISGNDGGLVGNPNYVPGVVDDAYSFNGSMQAVAVGNPSTLRLQDFTIEAWIQRSSASSVSSSGNAIIFGYGSGGYGFYLDASGRLALSQMDSTAVALDNPRITDTNFHHVAVIKSAGVVTFFIDGLDYTAAVNYNPLFVFNTSAAIGARGDNFDNSFLGVVDELSVYNRALSATEIRLIYNSWTAGKCYSGLPPIIVSQPSDQTISTGSSATFEVGVYGKPPLHYQWGFNGVGLDAATNSFLTISAAQISDAGSYAVVITNTFGSVTSSIATLSVVLAPPCVPPIAGLVSWWPGQRSSVDVAGHNNGTPVGNLSYVQGEVGQAFSFNGNRQGVLVGNPADLQLQNFTIECWIRRSSNAIVSDSGVAILFGYGQSGYGFYLDASGRLALSQIDLTAVTLDNPRITDTNFHHVAVTKSQGVVMFFIDGLGYTAPTDYNPVFVFNTSAAIGARGDNFANSFMGVVDELSVYNGALSATEVGLIYNSQAAGKCNAQVAPPTIVSQPADQTTFAGYSAAFDVTVYGKPPLHYQWRLNGVDLAAATNSFLTISDAQASDAGSYAVVITNSLGSVTSSIATLMLVPTPPCAPVIAGLVSWWPGQTNSLDVAGHNDGTAIGNLSYVQGEVGQAFSFNGSGQGVLVGNPADLQLQNFTIECWIRRSSNWIVSVSGNAILFGYGNSGYGFYLDASGRLALSAMDSSAITLGSPAIKDTEFHHVAVTKSASTVIFYIDGTDYPAPEAYGPTFFFLSPAAIGARGDNLANSFLGTIDELAIYQGALSKLEIQSIYHSSAGGKCDLAHSPPRVFTEPMDQVVAVGFSTMFAVDVGGTPPFSYQWRLDGADLAGETGATLLILNAQSNNAGAYSLAITNKFGAVTSVNANLSVVPAPPCLPAPPGLVSWWPGQTNTLDVAENNGGTLVGNTGYGSGIIGSAFVFSSSGQGVSVGNPLNLQLQNFTIEAWVRRANNWQISPSGSNAVLFGYGAGGYLFYLDPNGSLKLGDPYADPVTLPSPTVSDTRFHHVAVTKSAQKVFFYIDGVEYAADRPLVQNFVFDAPAGIGFRADTLNDTFLGTIDEISIYDRALSPAEIGSIAQAFLVGKCPSKTPPGFVSQPVDQTVIAGSSGRFEAQANGTPPLTFQWRFNGLDLAGASSSALTILNAQTNNVGTYSVRVSNAFGSVTSTNISLSVVVPSPCAPAPQGLVSWWSAEGNGSDSAGDNDGSFVHDPLYAPGEVGKAFLFDGNQWAVRLANPVNLQLQNFTIDAWIRRSSNWISSPFGGDAFLFGYGPGGYGFVMDELGHLALSQVTSNAVVLASPTIIDTAFHHVAVTKSGNNVRFFIDGMGYQAAPYQAQFTFNTPAAIGARGDSLNNGFLGLIDELSIYNRALADAEIRSIYTASTSGKCWTPSGGIPVITAASVAGNLVLSWPISAAGFKLQRSQSLVRPSWVDVSVGTPTNATVITATLPLSASQMFYRLVLPRPN